MRLEVDSNTGVVIFGVSFLLMITVAIVAGLQYNKHKNEMILKADTCEKVVMIENGFTSNLRICLNRE